MSGYFYGLLSTCLFCGFFGLIAPNGALGKYLRLLGGICVLCVMLSPLSTYLQSWETEDLLSGLLGSDEQESEFDEIYNKALAEAGCDQLEEYWKERLCGELSLRKEQVSVQVALEEDESGYRPSQVWVTLSGSAILADPALITATVEKVMECPCVILYD